MEAVVEVRNARVRARGNLDKEGVWVTVDPADCRHSITPVGVIGLSSPLVRMDQQQSSPSAHQPNVNAP